MYGNKHRKKIYPMQEEEFLAFFEKKISHSIERYPHLLDSRLHKGFKRLIANSSKEFLISRSLNHLEKILLVQFFLQRKIEESLQIEAKQEHLFLKIFQCSSRICIALCVLDPYRFQQDQLLKNIQILLPGIQEISNSFYLWYHPELSYFFYYLEVHKLRGDDLSPRDLKKLARALQEQLQTTSPLTPALFWPYNEEESFRQVQHLLKEIQNSRELPQISLHFQQQTLTSIEFLIHIARPQSSESLCSAFDRLPLYLECFCHFHYISNTHFAIELGTFALKVPSNIFNVRDSINLLYARRYIIKLLETLLGPCRDYNGGLFEMQQERFETLRLHLSDKIPLFDLFAEKVFYALHPVEKRLLLSLEDATELFSAFSDVMQGKKLCPGKHYSERISIIKSTHGSDLPKLSQLKELKKSIVYAQLCFGGFHYHCLLENEFDKTKTLIENRSRKTSKILRLIFEEGEPPSLNPYHSSGDMRSRLLCKLLFEGLTRLNAEGIPELAGATHYECNNEGTLYHFKLRKSYWSNGERVTASDYATSLQRVLKDHLSHPEIHFDIKNAKNFKEKKVNANQVGIQALSIDHLQIELAYPDFDFLHQLALPFFFPVFGNIQEPKWFNGPYLVHEQSKEVLLLKRNPYFLNTKNQFFEEIEIRWNNDIHTIFNHFNEGKVDWIGDPLSTLSPSYIENLELHGKLHKKEVNRRFLVCFKTKHPVLSSPLIRRALSMAIDRSLICETIYPHSTPLSPLKPCKEEANALFEKGLKELGLTRKTFPTLTFSYSHQARREKLALCLQTIWHEVLGISISLEKIEWNIFRTRLEKGLFEICGTIQKTINENSPRQLDRLEGQSSWNFSGWTNLAYNRLIDKAKEETDGNVRQTMLLQADQILMQESPFTPLFKYTHLFAHFHELRGYQFDDEGCVDFSTSYLKNSLDSKL